MAEEETPAAPSRGRRLGKNVLHFCSHNALIFAISLGLVLGIITGLVLKITWKDYKFSKREVMYVGFLGTLYIRALKLVTLPLIIVSIITSMTNLSLQFAGMLGLRAFLYYFITTFLAVIWGIILVFSIAPGKDVEIKANVTEESRRYVRDTTITDSVLDLIRSIFPPNLVEACVNSDRTELSPPLMFILKPDGTFEKTEARNVDKSEWAFSTMKNPGANYLGICVVSIVFGITAIVVQQSTQPIREIFEAINEVVITIVTIIIWTSPVGVFSLVAAKLIEEDDYAKFFGQVAWYSLTVLIGVLTYGFIFLQIVYFVCTRKNPFRFSFNMIEAVTTAFATASSLATLPVTLRCVIEKNRVPAAVSRFVVPLGATVNMNGTALYEAVAPIFIVQVLKTDLTVTQVILVSFIATLASMGAAGIPQAGLVTMVMVLNILNLEADMIVYIIPVDWFLDRFRTALNVFGDAVGAAVVFALSKKDFKEKYGAEMYPLSS